MPKPSTKGLLKEIQSIELEWVYIHISNKAVEWAVAGFIAEANKLLESLWSHGLPHSGHLWIPDEGLQIIWEVSGIRPANPPFPFKDISKIENENWQRLFTPLRSSSFIDQVIHSPIDDLNGSQLFAKALFAAEYQSEPLSVIIDAFDRFLTSGEAVGYSYFHAASCAALLAAHNNLTNEAEHFIKLWGEGYPNYWANYTLAYLLRDRSTAKLLATGILAPVFNLTRSICEEEIAEIIAALENRLSNGRGLAYGHLSWQQLLKKISVIAVDQETFDFTDEAIAAKWLGRPPATPTEVEKAEKTLGVHFPQDYKEFLSVSNGFSSISSSDLTISSVHNADLLVNVESELVKIYSDLFIEIDSDFCKKLNSSIIIGGQEDEQKLLLVPLPNNDWECWFFATWAAPAETVYPAFRFYIEELLQKLEDDFFRD
jgi:hypothetical protein